ncbi:NADP-specific glutamate dehydrogenase [Bizionia gelidisalsuginis]|uniref:Glutamate dehydrogenase n=2 Tax=Bizionia TaxID=283785 RepID=A0A8H2QJK9_9FLAO|nr:MULTISPECIES: NADP-specific glutamate dehydrogenase [Bizionia]TYB75973.1 NADP-specific glutamate dehydrogenase [Bizionia saleffrena]TYC13476.1 NADP-specific glutamate dehydrogenase [Bizionia gelidisalsuginis]
MQTKIEAFFNSVKEKNSNEKEFLQAVYEVAEIIIPFIEAHPKYQNKMLLERIVEPERAIIFRVPWLDDSGKVQVNRGFRVEFNSAIGPYKGGLRFHPSVNLSILKFLGFEQVFKNSLTTLPLGGGKGGSDFNPKGKSDNEVMRFCQSFMGELFRHIGADTDVPAGDIGVGSREIGYLFGYYKKIKNEFTGVLTGKDLSYGGSLIRPEATGYGCVYFIQSMLKTKNDSIKNKKVVISGSGNVAQYACQKITELGGKVVAMSDSTGYIYDEKGIDAEKLQVIMTIKNENRGRIQEYLDTYKNAQFFEGQRPWGVACDIAIPCATQNELNKGEAEELVKNKVLVVAEGANMPTTPKAIEILQQANVLFAPGKAANAGGVATSGLEMSQNALRYSWKKEKVDEKLREIMYHIHASCEAYGKNDAGEIDYVKGANIAGFVKVADAMLAQGVV